MTLAPAALTQATPRRVDIGERFPLIAPWSEVCMHMRIAGERVEAELLDHGSVQLHKDGQPFSVPISRTEASVFLDAEGFYYYPPLEDEQ